jgi:hypothetical protein
MASDYKVRIGVMGNYLLKTKPNIVIYKECNDTLGFKILHKKEFKII